MSMPVYYVTDLSTNKQQYSGVIVITIAKKVLIQQFDNRWDFGAFARL